MNTRYLLILNAKVIKTFKNYKKALAAYNHYASEYDANINCLELIDTKTCQTLIDNQE